MYSAHQLVGKKIKAKTVRHGFPVAIGKVTSVQNAVFGNVRVILESGHKAVMLYPPIEVLD